MEADIGSNGSLEPRVDQIFRGQGVGGACRPYRPVSGKSIFTPHLISKFIGKKKKKKRRQLERLQTDIKERKMVETFRDNRRVSLALAAGTSSAFWRDDLQRREQRQRRRPAEVTQTSLCPHKQEL